MPRPDPRRARGAPGPRTDALALAAIAALAIALRVHRLGEPSLWLDELYSYWASRLSWRDLWVELPGVDKHTPLYYSLLKLWSVFGESEAALRSLSAVAGALAVPCAYVLGRLAAPPGRARWSGAAAALLAAVHPLLIEYSQEARAYSAWALAVAFMLCGAAWLARSGAGARVPGLGWSRSAGAPPGVAARARLAWASVIAGAALTAWLHNIGVLVVLALALMAPPWLGRAHRWARAVTANALLAASAVALLCAPFAPMLLAQTSAVAARFWIPETTPTSLARLAGSVAVGPFAPAGPHGILGNAGAGAVALAAGWGAVRIARDASRPIGVLLVGIVAVPAAAAVAFSVLVRPIVIPRIFIWATVPLCVLLGVAVASLDRRAARLAAAGLFAALLLSSAWRYHRTAEKEPWRELVAIISRDAAAGDLVVLAPGGNHRGLSYYGRFGPAAPTFVRVEWSPERPALARQSAPLRHRPSDPGGSAPRTLAFVDVTVPHIDELGALARRARAVWLLSRHPPAFPRLTRAVAAELDRTRVAARHWPGTGLSLTLYR